MPTAPTPLLRRLVGRLLLPFLAVLFTAWLRPIPHAGAVVPDAEVRVLELDGVVSPVSARFLRRELGNAAADRAALVVIRLDTPGGLERSMREMTAEIIDSPIPVVVWVAPSGARAASAGLFLTLSAHVAAMAPGTSIGAAHPVPLGGGDDTVTEKVVADAAAYARSLATLRGRNGAWAEQAVLESVAASADEAVALGVVDLIAGDLDALLEVIEGEVVRTSTGPTTVRAVSHPVSEREMPLHERILQAITDPNVAYVLFTVGVIGLVGELYAPGTLLPGVTGVICLVLAFVAMGSLPVSGAGIALLLVGLGLLVGDLLTDGLGILAIPGLIAFVLGSIMLYQPLSPASPALPAVRISPWLIVATTGVLVAFFAVVIRALVRSTRAPVASGAEALVGKIGRAASPLTPAGTVRLDGETWTAVSDDGTVPAGARVEVVAVSGVTLRVRIAPDEPSRSPP